VPPADQSPKEHLQGQDEYICRYKKVVAADRPASYHEKNMQNAKPAESPRCPYWEVYYMQSSTTRGCADLQITEDQRLSLRSGKRLGWSQPIEALLHGPPLFADRVPGIAEFVLMMSDKARGCLSPLLQNEVEFLPVVVRNAESEICGRLWLVNSLRIVDCIDHAASAKSEDEKQTRKYFDLAIDLSKIPSQLNLFRIATHERHTCIHNRVKNAVRKHRLTGFTFLDQPYVNSVPDAG
jgi:hypothetical protein